ncbi:hypothetical protein [Streptomyces sp. WAC08241]|uniref:hypothetical protein n=1 Tax=Streptomyces sp. WAC08241 TaxID=2487421 RepID=UPI000F79400F|nr:hypothetical protein [Streptomyces sp. WAC08241]RSS35660.1 hypothetical protein EF906_26935 [Streptomyces sp. WAC08241]
MPGWCAGPLARGRTQPRRPHTARYEPLAEAVRTSRQRFSLVFRFDETVKKDLDRARTFCEDP